MQDTLILNARRYKWCDSCGKAIKVGKDISWCPDCGKPLTKFNDKHDKKAPKI